jgi:class 3 adenylate cyclase
MCQLCLIIQREAVQYPANIPFLTLALVGTFGLLGASWLPWPFLSLTQAYVTLFLVLTFVLDMLTATVRGIVYILIPIGLLLIIKEHWTTNICIVGFSSLLICIDSAAYIVCSDRNWGEMEEVIGTLVVYMMVTVISAITAYRNNYSSRVRFQLFKETERRMVQNENILSFFLPDFVRRQVKDGFRYIAEDKDSVSVLFCEICHFDSIVATYSPIDLTELLDDVFHQIDELCMALGVAKIETVGKVYMACTGLSDFESELASELQAVPYAQRALELAFAVINTFKNYRLQTGASIQFKIGIHTGSVIAGVVGYIKPQFSLVGDTVNTASRMSTTAPEPNTIQVSESTFQELKATATMCDFTVRNVLVKGKGEQTTYLAREVAGVPKTRRRTGSEDATSILRGNHRHRSSIVNSLRESLELQEAFAKDDQKLGKQMQWLPCGHVSSMENQFCKDSANRHIRDLRLGLQSYILGLALRLAVEFRLETNIAIVPGTLFTLALVMCIGVRIRLDVWRERRWLPWCLIGIYVVVGLGLCAEHWLANLPTLTTLELALTLVLMHYCSGLLFRHVLLGSVVILVPWITVCIARQTESWEYAIFSLLFAIQHCIHKYFDEKNERLLFSLSELASSEIEKTERLLSHMLPGHAYESLKLEEWVSDRLSRVTLLFADVSGFTAWASVHTPQEVVTYLSTVYASFDKVCTRLGLYKVHTIGDCYVAMSATNNNDMRDPGEECKRMLSLAQAMVEELQDQTEGLNMRIGLHCGDVIACITGSQVVRYDIYGNDVLIANRMESCGMTGKINVSEDVKSLMESSYPGSFSFTPNKEVRIEDIQRSVQSFFLASV